MEKSAHWLWKTRHRRSYFLKRVWISENRSASEPHDSKGFRGLRNSPQIHISKSDSSRKFPTPGWASVAAVWKSPKNPLGDTPSNPKDRPSYSFLTNSSQLRWGKLVGNPRQTTKADFIPKNRPGLPIQSTHFARCKMQSNQMIKPVIHLSTSPTTATSFI